MNSSDNSTDSSEGSPTNHLEGPNIDLEKMLPSVVSRRGEGEGEEREGRGGGERKGEEGRGQACGETEEKSEAVPYSTYVTR